jgi:hypothetical protein
MQLVIQITWYSSLQQQSSSQPTRTTSAAAAAAMPDHIKSQITKTRFAGEKNKT